MYSTPRFIRGLFAFDGLGLLAPSPLGAGSTYDVPADKRAQIVYLRAGNSSDALICLTLTKDNEILRYFPVGARQAIHVPLTVTEDVFPESHLAVHCSAPAGVSGTVVVDLGLLEVD